MIRDKTIDRLRGFAMIWVIVVHVLYWGNFFTNDTINYLKSFCLFEMPLFFFIIGASSSFTKIKSYSKYVIKRFIRIIIPYWVFAIICAIMSVIKYRLDGNLNFITLLKTLFSWIIPINKQMTSIPYLTWALWFIPVFLCINLLIPGLKRLKETPQRVFWGFLLILTFIVTVLLKMGWVQNVAFYAFWTYIGLFYPQIKSAIAAKKMQKYLICIIACGIITLYIFHLLEIPLDMQANKFPPNILFFVFSVITMAIIMLLIPLVDLVFDYLEKFKFLNKFLHLFKDHSITIFLYQSFAFLFSIKATELLFTNGSLMFSIIKAAFCLITTLSLCAIFALIFSRVELIGTKFH